jgi:transposase InsO family protein
MEPIIKTRLTWVQLYIETQDAGLVCRRCGISRPTLRKWIRRFEQFGLEGLKDLSRRPRKCPPPKVLTDHCQWILQLRKRRLGARRIQSELLRLYNFSLSTATIHKVLKRSCVKPLKATRQPRKGTKRYEKEIPGERVQMDVCKIAPKLYQYTAIDDCTRLKVIRLYPNKQANSTLAFIEQVLSAFPFPIQRLQTDRGHEFMAHSVQKRLMELHIKFRPTKPRSPHLNGKVERTQRTDLEEFYSQVDLKSAQLGTELLEWEGYYNHERRHSSIRKTPWQKWQEVAHKVPSQAEVEEIYKQKQERIRHTDYRRDIGKPRKTIRL